jgi:hypothetical protein
MYNLFLDDVRIPTTVKRAIHNGEWVDFPSHYKWEIVRSYKEFVEIITLRRLPASIAYDHDLSYEDQNKTEGFVEKTGLDCAKWLVEYCLDNNMDLPGFYVHSFNTVGRKNICDYLDRFPQIQAAFKNKS